MNFNIDWGFTLAVVVVGLVVVFAVLLILVFLCSVMGSTFKKIDNNKKSKFDNSQNKTKENKAATNTPVKAVAAAPVVENGINDDVVAAISAAIACIMGSDKKFALRSIKRSRGGSRPAWNTAGIIDNTRSF